MDDRDASNRETVDIKGPRGDADDAPSDSPQTLFAGRADRFHERDELGRGGMGRVVEAYDRAFGRTVAVKHLLATDDTSLARFEREAVLTARLEHPGIVPVHDAGRTGDGKPFYVMKRVDGDPLDRLIDGEPFEKRLTRIPNVLAVCDACAYAHARGVIHRDLKPSNILVGPFGETLVIDWGLARSRTDRAAPDTESAGDAFETRAGAVSGTPAFMAPEQARGDDVDERADVYALGATLFYVLAGAVPYDSPSASLLVGQVGRGRAPEWTRLPRDTPPELRAIVEKAMAAERSARYANAGALAADLRSYVNGQLVGAYEYGAWERLRRFVRRHRAAIAVAAVAAIVIAAGTVISVRRIISERDDARAARRVASAQRDHLLVQHARELAESDPAAAVIALRALPEDSSEWPFAAAAMATAELHGIPIGFLPDGAQLHDVALSPDGRQAAVKTIDGEIFVYDLVAGTHRDTHLRTSDPWVAWLDAKWLVVPVGSTVLRLDTTNGTLRRLAIDANVQRMIVDAGQAWLVTEANTLYVVDATTITAEGRTADDLGRWAPVDGAMVLERHDALELWTKSDHRELGIPSDSGVASEGHQVAANHDGVTCVWNLPATGPPVKRVCVTAEAQSIVYAIVAGHAWSLSGTTLAAVNDAGGKIPLTGLIMNAPGSAITLMSESQRLWLPTSDGWRQLGSSGTKYSSTSSSADGRVFAAVTTTGELRVWQLGATGPRRFVGGGDHIAGVAGGHAWTIADSGQIVDLDVATGSASPVAKLSYSGLITNTLMDGDWLVLWSNDGLTGPGSYQVYDVRGGVAITPREGEDLASAHGTLLAFDNADVSVVHPDGVREPLAHFPVGRLRGAARAGGVVAVYGGENGRTLCELAGGNTRCTTFTKPIEETMLRSDGVVWAITAGELWRWKPGDEPRRYHAELGFRAIIEDGDRAIAYAAEAMVDLEHPDAAPVATPPIAKLSWLDHDRVVGIGADGQSAVIDVRSGARFNLPFTSGVEMRAGGGAVATADGRGLWVYRPTVPTAPAALRDWLAHATNAVAVPGSDAVSWPK